MGWLPRRPEQRSLIPRQIPGKAYQFKGHEAYNLPIAIGNSQGVDHFGICLFRKSTSIPKSDADA